VLVVVALMAGVPVSVVDVVDMVAVGNGVMPAARLVAVAVLVVGDVRQWVLVVVALVRGVRVAIVHVVDMALMLGARVATT
jgi:hypothetical protein